MPALTRRTLLTGAATFFVAADPALAQWTRPPVEDDPFYDTRPGYGATDPRRPWSDTRRGLDPDSGPGPGPGPGPGRRRRLDPAAGEEPYGGRSYDPPSNAGPYDGTPSSDPYFEGPYGPRPAAPPVTRPTASADGAGIDYARAYAAQPGERFPVPAIRWKSFNPAFLRQPVAYRGSEPPGTIIVDPRAHHLTLVEEGGRAMRYGVGVGKQGFSWSGVSTVNVKQEWPDWYPPKEMIQRQPALARQVSQLQSGLGVPGGSRNPLGARALYLWQNNKDTLYRIHGTTEPFSIGKSVSSGCIRMINQDAIDLYGRVPVGARVVVLG